MKRAMVERAVMSERSLREVKNRETDQIAQIGESARFSYSTFIYLLKEAAKTTDKERAQKTRPRKRRTNIHQLATTEESNEDESELDQLFQAWITRRLPGSRMNKETWTSLDPSTQKAWDTIDDKDKAAILSYAEQRSAKQAQDKTTLEANVHEGEDHDSSDSEDEEQESPDAELQANVTKGSKEKNETKGKAHPGDIRRVLAGNKRGDKKKRAAHNVMWKAHTHHQTPYVPEDFDPDGDEPPEFAERNDDPSSSDSSAASGFHNVLDMVDDYWGEQEEQFFH
jgi:hypothetical protein